MHNESTSAGGDRRQSTPNKPAAGHQIFRWIRSTGLSRPEGGWAGGVLAGVAEKLGWDATLVRGLGVVAFILFFSPAALFYGLAWLFLPDAEGRIHAQQALRGEYPSGLWGAAALTLIGALNVFTPVSVAGPFAVLLNLLILAVVAWVGYLIFRSWRSSDEPSPYDVPTSHGSKARNPFARAETSASGNNDDAPRGAGSDSGRPDGKPAWYPKEGPEESRPSGGAQPDSPASAQQGDSAGPHSTYAAGSSPYPVQSATAVRTEHPAQDPREREATRRRRMVTFGILLLALPALAAAAYFAAGLGFSSPSAVLVALAILVVLLGMSNIVAGLRGRRGRTGLLVIFTTLMMVLFSGHNAGIDGRGANYVFGDYHSVGEQAVNTAFASTEVDLRQLRSQMAEQNGGDAEDPDWSYTQPIEVNTAFANTTILVPDDTHVVIQNAHALSNLEIRSQEFWHNVAGFGAPGAEFGNDGPDPAQDTIELHLNTAFGNVTIYDATTYDQEVLGLWEEDYWDEATEEDDFYEDELEYYETGFMTPEYRDWLREFEIDDNFENYRQWQEETAEQ